MINVVNLTDKRASTAGTPEKKSRTKVGVQSAASGGNRVKLTTNNVSNLKPSEGKRRWVADTEMRGLYLAIEASKAVDETDRLTPVSRSYYVRGRIGRGRSAKRVDIRIGSVEAVRLADARDIARTKIYQMQGGLDPRRRREAKSLIVSELVAFYREDLLHRGVVRWKDTVGYLERGLPKLMKHEATSVTRNEFLAVIKQVEIKIGLPSADALRRSITGMLNTATEAGLVENNVMAGYRKPKATRAERLVRQKKNRPVLKGADEIRHFWQASAAAKSNIYCDYLRVLLLTGQRGIELAKAEGRDFDIKDGIWHARAETRKNGKALRVPLGHLSKEIIARYLYEGGSDALVFAGTRGALITAGQSKRLMPVKAAMEASCGRGEIAQHTLRRAYRTRLAEMGVQSELAELMLGHSREELVEIYDQSDALEQRRAAQNAFENWMAEVVANAD